MRVLLTGGTGFIGRNLCARLVGDGHRVVLAVRDPASVERRFPGIPAVGVDMNRMTAVENWLPILDGVDAVVNCAGVLQSSGGQSARAVHADSPKALFAACVRLGIHRVVQISAVSADTAAGTEYALTKKAADDYLRSLDLDWVVLRPSLVYGQGSYGGTSAIRALAAFPGVTPMIGDGNFPFQPLHIDDLAETVVRALTSPALARRTVDAVGPETMSLAEIVSRTRAWLNLPPVPRLAVPIPIVHAVARAADLINSGPISSTAIAQLEYGNVADAAGFVSAIGFTPRTMAESFRASPSHTQDVWHARLYGLRPLISAALVALWAGSGIVGLAGADSGATWIAEHLPVERSVAYAASLFFSLLDLAIAGWLLSGRSQRWLGPIQFILVLAYTVAIGWLAPHLWLDPFGSLLKNLPVLALVAVWAILRDER